MIDLEGNVFGVRRVDAVCYCPVTAANACEAFFLHIAMELAALLVSIQVSGVLKHTNRGALRVAIIPGGDIQRELVSTGMDLRILNVQRLCGNRDRWTWGSMASIRGNDLPRSVAAGSRRFPVAPETRSLGVAHA